MSESQKNVLLEQSKNYILKNNSQIERFWLTRNLDKILSEAKTLDNLDKLKPTIKIPKQKSNEGLNEGMKKTDPLANIMALLR